MNVLKELRAVQPFKIDYISIDPPLILAPMAGTTNHAFRVICKRIGGVGLVCAEMLSSHGLHYGGMGSRSMLDWTDEERPVSVQIFGARPDIMASAATRLEEAGADIIDINIGCPVPKVVKSGASAALLKDLPLASRIIRSVVEAVKVPVTIKTRKGWDDNLTTAVELGRIAQDCGVKAITIHGRTAKQSYSGKADWDIIRRVKEAVSIPVVGNGDVTSPEAALNMFRETGCDGVMIGRAALGNPWIFPRTVSYLNTGVIPAEPPIAVRVEMAMVHAGLLADAIGGKHAAHEMRGHIGWYVKGTPGASAVRAKLAQIHSIEELRDVLHEACGQH